MLVLDEKVWWCGVGVWCGAVTRRRCVRERGMEGVESGTRVCVRREGRGVGWDNL